MKKCRKEDPEFDGGIRSLFEAKTRFLEVAVTSEKSVDITHAADGRYCHAACGTRGAPARQNGGRGRS